jgi:hypothetical protein
MWEQKNAGFYKNAATNTTANIKPVITFNEDAELSEFELCFEVLDLELCWVTVSCPLEMMFTNCVEI